MSVTSRSSHRRFSMKKLFLKISQYSQENTDVGFSFNKVAGLKNTYFEKHQQRATSGLKKVEAVEDCSKTVY